jgi:hypothetical protein
MLMQLDLPEHIPVVLAHGEVRDAGVSHGRFDIELLFDALNAADRFANGSVLRALDRVVVLASSSSAPSSRLL